MVQSKGTSTPQISLDGAVHYRLRDLAFPAYVALEVTLDPGILFLVLNTGKRGQERVFWKYISPRFLASLDFSKDSAVIRFTGGDEIKNTEESGDDFVCSSNDHSLGFRSSPFSWPIQSLFTRRRASSTIPPRRSSPAAIPSRSPTAFSIQPSPVQRKN